MNVYDEIRHSRGWFIALGVALIVLGSIAIGTAMFTTLISVMFFGWLLMLGGVVQGVHAFRVRTWSGLLLQLLLGILNIIVGLLIAANPGANALTLTLLIAAFFVIGGLLRIIHASGTHLPGRGWVLFNGLVNIMLGVFIWLRWPASGFWVIGLFIGIDLLFTGWWFVTLAMLSRRMISSPG